MCTCVDVCVDPRIEMGCICKSVSHGKKKPLLTTTFFIFLSLGVNRRGEKQKKKFFGVSSVVPEMRDSDKL